MPPSGTSRPTWTVTDHVPTAPSECDRSLHRGHSPPSVRTRNRLSSTRYEPVTSVTPSTLTWVIRLTGAGSVTSEIRVHEHEPTQRSEEHTSELQSREL